MGGASGTTNLLDYRKPEPIAKASRLEPMYQRPLGAALHHILSAAAQEFWNDLANKPFKSQSRNHSVARNVGRKTLCTGEPLSSMAQL